jgi:ZIP family zinc transporter
MTRGSELAGLTARLSGPPGLLVAALVMVAVATLAGARLAGGRGNRRQVWFGAAAGALLVIAVLHIFPDAWSSAERAGIAIWLVPLVAVGAFTATVVVSRVGCACDADEEHASGTGAAVALAIHRFLEGAALALTGPVTAVALGVHAFGEGMAVGALLRERRRQLAVWLVVMCCGPALGALATAAVPVLDAAEPLLLATAAGVLAQAARISLRAAFPRSLSGSRLTPAPAFALVTAAAITTVAVQFVG